MTHLLKKYKLLYNLFNGQTYLIIKSEESMKIKLGFNKKIGVLLSIISFMLDAVLIQY